MTMAWKPEVRTGHDPRWYDNALRFATEAEARDSARDLAHRWLLVEDWRAVECADPVTHSYLNGRLESL
jgi:hypothetical protein